MRFHFSLFGPTTVVSIDFETICEVLRKKVVGGVVTFSSKEKIREKQSKLVNFEVGIGLCFFMQLLL